MKENQIGIPLEGFSAFTRKVASEGMVLLKNEEQMLPLKEGEHVAIFGRSQIDYYRNGTGSGGAVNVAYTVHILDGLRAQNGCVVDEILADRYSEWIQTHPYDNGNGAWAAEPWHQEEMPVTEELLCQASDRNQKAIVVIGRTAGEDQDNKKEEGSYLLTTEERALLQGVCRYFDQVAVLLNVSNIIDMGWMEEELSLIRRNPLNGRNFEYYSEDPLVSGMMAAAAVRGIRKGGGEATLKHFACNNQEEGRTTAEAVVSERALREIYLKGFEIAIKEGEAHSVMSSYNPLNGYWTASNYDLLTTILREEWGFTGIVMTDWWAKMNHVIKGGEPSTTYTGYMLRAQNDIYMVVSNNGAEVNASQDDTLHALQRGELTIGELQRAAGNICNFIMKCLAFRTEKRIQSTERIITPIVDGPDTTIIGDKLQLSEKDMSRGFEVDQEGVFDVLIRCRCMGNNQMQAASNILLNKQEINILQTNGTDGKWIIQKLTKVSLAKGYYKPSIESLKEGIQIEWIEFIRKN